MNLMTPSTRLLTLTWTAAARSRLTSDGHALTGYLCEVDGSLSTATSGHVALLLKVAHFDSSSAEIAGATKLWPQLSLALA